MEEVQLDAIDPESAPGVCELVRAMYGDGHPDRQLYDPKALLQLHASGRQRTWVARIGARVVGCASVDQPAPFPDLYSLGHALVLPEFRGRSIALQLSMLAASEVFQDPSAVGGVTLTGCHWLKTQELVFHGGFMPSALLPDVLAPEAMPFEHRGKHPVAQLVSFFCIVDRPQEIYVPDSLQELMEGIYANLQLQRELRPARLEGVELPGPSEVRLVEDGDAIRADVLQFGTDLPARLPENGRISQVVLRLDSPLVAAGVDLLHPLGYRACGVLPRWFGHDGLVLQKNPRPAQLKRAQLYAEPSKKLARLLQEAWS